MWLGCVSECVYVYMGIARKWVMRVGIDGEGVRACMSVFLRGMNDFLQRCAAGGDWTIGTLRIWMTC